MNDANVNTMNDKIKRQADHTEPTLMLGHVEVDRSATNCKRGMAVEVTDSSTTAKTLLVSAGTCGACFTTATSRADGWLENLWDACGDMAATAATLVLCLHLQGRRTCDDCSNGSCS